jgi:hypothetical protein
LRERERNSHPVDSGFPSRCSYHMTYTDVASR